MRCFDCKYCMYNREINNYECLNSDSEFYDTIVWENDFCMDYEVESIGGQIKCQ